MRYGMDLYTLLDEQRAAITAIARRYGATDIRVFGSVVRHEAGEASDIDLLVELEPGRTLFDLGGISYDLERLPGRRVDVVTAPLLRAEIRGRVLAEAVPLGGTTSSGSPICAQRSRRSNATRRRSRHGSWNRNWSRSGPCTTFSSSGRPPGPYRRSSASGHPAVP